MSSDVLTDSCIGPQRYTVAGTLWARRRDVLAPPAQDPDKLVFLILMPFDASPFPRRRIVMNTGHWFWGYYTIKIGLVATYELRKMLILCGRQVR